MSKSLVIENLSKTYRNGKVAVDNLSFQVEKGEFITIIGPSGAGKSTVLRCINGLVKPNEGEIYFEGKKVNDLKDKKFREARRRMGMIFQHYNLVYSLTVMQNVMHGRLGYMSTINGMLSHYNEEDKYKALELLNRVGLSEHLYRRASELSGGEKQRVGIVRALMQEPTLLLCDEPIASLDPNSSKIIMDLIKNLTKEKGITCIVNLHQVHVAMEYADRIIGIRRGSLIFEGTPSELTNDIIEKIYDTSINNLIINNEVKLDA